MNQIRILSLNREAIATAVKFALLISVASLAPLLGQQAVVGSIVNATLFISVVLLGSQRAILIGLFPSLISLATGMLPPVLAPMIPFIIAGNAILVSVFGFFGKKKYWLGMIPAALLKFAFLAAASNIIISLLLKKEIAGQVAVMLSWPQLFTAISGGLIAYLFLKGIKKI